MSTVENRNLATIFIVATVLLNAMAVGIVIPILPALIVQLTGSSADAGVTNGLLIALVAVLQFLVAPLLGALSDCFGRRPVLLVSTAGLACDYAIMATAPSVAWLYLGRVVAGISSATGSAVNAYVADTTHTVERARVYGLVGAAASSGGIVGQLLGGALAGVSLRAPFWAAGALTALAFVYGSLILPESLAPSRRTDLRWRCASPTSAIAWLYSRRELRSLTAVYLLVYGANAAFSVIFVLYVQYRYHWSLGRTGAILAASSLFDIIVQALAVGPMIRHFGERVTVISGLIAGLVAYGCMGLAENEAIFILALVPLGMGMVVTPALQSAMTRRVSESEQGRLQGSVVSISCVSLAVAPIIFGGVYSSTATSFIDKAQPGEAFLVAACMLLGAAVCAAATTENTPDDH